MKTCLRIRNRLAGLRGLAVVLASLITTSVSAQGLAKVWDRTYGGNSLEYANALISTTDGGYLVGCTSFSPISGDRTQAGGGAQDYWVVKLDSVGHKQWDRAWGGRDDESLTCLLATPDGGYLLGGHTDTNYAPFGDISGQGRGEDDFWLVKMDARGNKLWDRRIGGLFDDYLLDMVPMADGGFVLVGLSNSPISGEKTTPAYGNLFYGPEDCWVVKINAQGTVQWDRTLGGAGADRGVSVVVTNDGGFLIGGVSSSPAAGTKTAALVGLADYWVTKLDASGNSQWQATYGAPGATSNLAKVVLAPGGQSALLVGNSNGSQGGTKTESSRGGKDYWLVSIATATGAVLWDRTAGSSGDDYAATAVPTPGGGWLVGGTVGAGTGGECTAPRRGGQDYWLLRLLPTGQLQDNYCLGGSDAESLGALLPVGGSWAVAGSSSSAISGDKSESLRGWSDAWIVKLGLPTIESEVLLCAGGQQELRAPALASGIRWSTGATTSTITVAQPGTYNVTYTLPDGAAGVLHFNVRPFAPTVAIIGNVRLCPGSSALLTADAPGATAFAWNTGPTSRTLTVTQPGTYAVTVTFGTGCTRMAQAVVLAEHSNQPFSLGADTTLCEDEVLVLRAPAWDGETPNYRWSDGSTGLTLQVAQAGTYSLQRTSACEIRTASRQVVYRSCATIPNVITPDNDGVNDVFVALQMPRGAWGLAIYNRWGKQVFQTDNYRYDWGRDVAPGVYFYRFFQADSDRSYKGWVEVIR